MTRLIIKAGGAFILCIANATAALFVSAFTPSCLPLSVITQQQKLRTLSPFFVTAKKKTQSSLPQKTALSVMLDPNDLLVNAQLYHHHQYVLHQQQQQQQQHVVSTATTNPSSIAISSIATANKEWSFLWFHGPSGPQSSVSPYISDYNEEDYLPVVNNNNIKNTELSEDDEEKMGIINLEDMVKLNTMPGPTTTSTSGSSVAALKQPSAEIGIREFEWTARNFDLFLSRLPAALLVYALLDFFILPNQYDFSANDLEENRDEIVDDWVTGSVVRFGVLFIVIMLTVLCENLFYHPI